MTSSTPPSATSSFLLICSTLLDLITFDKLTPITILIMPASMASDLRSEAKSFQRDKNHNVKWSKGGAPRPGYQCPAMHVGPGAFCSCEACPVGRPAGGYDHRNVRSARAKQREQKKEVAHATTLARKAFRNELSEAFDGPLAHVTDNSSDDEVHHASTAPLPVEADFMYSYDASTGPTAGNDVLSAALNKAVLRFENTETEKLVTREYDVIDQLKEGYAADEEDGDFEMIEHAHLN